MIGKILIIIFSFMLLNINSDLFADNNVTVNQHDVKAIDLSKYKDHPLLYSIIKELKNSDQVEKERACQILMKLGNRRAIQPLVAYVSSLNLALNDNIYPANRAANALIALHDIKANTVVEKLFDKYLSNDELSTLDHNDKFIKKIGVTAWVILAQRGNKQKIKRGTLNSLNKKEKCPSSFNCKFLAHFNGDKEVQ
jgi:hypothetical protein